MGGELPRVTTFQQYATLLTKRGEYKRAIEVCEEVAMASMTTQKEDLRPELTASKGNRKRMIQLSGLMTVIYLTKM